MGETFTKNTLITFITRILSSVFTILGLIIIARVLGPEGKGIYTLVLLFSSALVTFTLFGVTTATTFYTGKKKYSYQEILGNNVIFSLLIGIISIAIGLFIIFFFGDKFFPGIKREYLLLILFAIHAIFSSAFISHILIGMEKIKKFNILFLFQSLFLLILIFILLFLFNLGVKAAILAYILSFIFYGIILFFATKKETGGIVLKFNINYFKDIFSYGLKIYPSHIFSFLHFRVSMFLINFFLNPVALGLYSVGVGLSGVLWIFSTSISTVLMPRVVSEKNSKRLKRFTPLVCRNVLFGLLIITILLFIFSRFLIVFLYSEKFIESVSPFQILLLAALAICGWEILSSDIAGRGKQIFNSYISGASLILNIILSILFIPKWGIVGSAWALAISSLFMFFMVAIVYNRISGNKMRNLFFLQGSDIRLYKDLLNSIKNFKNL